MPNRKYNESIILTIKSKTGSLFNKQEVFAITSKNLKGIFDVLPEHENFISIVKDYIVVHKKRNDKQEIKIETGIIKVNDNNVDIFLSSHST